MLTEVPTCEKGCWNLFLVVDGSKEEYHAENDCAYNFITITNQVLHARLYVKRKQYFSFKLNERQNIYVLMSAQCYFLSMQNFSHINKCTHHQMMKMILMLIMQLYIKIRNYSII